MILTMQEMKQLFLYRQRTLYREADTYREYHDFRNAQMCNFAAKKIEELQKELEEVEKRKLNGE